jgi:hypothetical protein
MQPATLKFVHGHWQIGQKGKVKRHRRNRIAVDAQGHRFRSQFEFFPDNLLAYGFFVRRDEINIENDYLLLRKGDKVYWTDPDDGIASATYTVNICPDNIVHDSIIDIENNTSFNEVPAHELKLL